MLYLHFCPPCDRIHILSGHHVKCPACDSTVTELSVTYEKYIKLSRKQRESLLEECAEPASLKAICKIYAARRPRK